MLSGDSRSSWDSHVLDDPRVSEYWDGDRTAGKWFANEQIGGRGGLGLIVWDAFYAFARDSIWNSEPTGLVATGSDIIDNVSHLQQNFIPLLRE